MVIESVSERQVMCDRITETLASGEFDRGDLLRMEKDLSTLLHEMAWEVKNHLSRRNASPQMEQADRWIVSGKSALTWVEANAPFALIFELARCIEIANAAALKVLERLRLQDDGEAA